MSTKIGVNYLYTGKGPFDAKMLVSRYGDLLKPETFGGYQYNGMIVGVAFAQSADVDKVGIYYLYDETVSSGFKAVDNTKEENWHRLGTIGDLNKAKEELSSDIQAALLDIQDRFNKYDTAIEGLQSIAKDHDAAIKALQSTNGVSEEVVDAMISNAISNLDASNIIDNNTNYAIGFNKNNPRELVINHVNISKLHQDVQFILDGGSAQHNEFN